MSLRDAFGPLLLTLSMSLVAGCVTDTRTRAPAVEGLPRDDASATLSAVWIGHATVLLRLGDVTVLADPNFGMRQFLYPRLTPPSVAVRELPPVDAVLVSHLHPDHFDPAALRALGSHPEAVFPRGAEGYTRRLPQRLTYLEPWASITVRGARITAVPVSHSGGRWAVDGLWNHAYTGYVIEAAGHTVFFAGDTGYDPRLFHEIARRFPNIELAFVPIAPARGGNRNHASPAEALDIFRDLGARYLVPIHFESFYSSVIPYDEPRRVLAAEVEKRGLGGRVFALHTGERWIREGQAAPLVIRSRLDDGSAVASQLARP